MALVKQTIERVPQEAKDFDYEYRLLMPDGSVKHVHVVAHAVSDESDSIDFVGAVMDVTERRQAEQALGESEEQWKAVFENNPTMYFMVDAGGTVLSVNQGAEQLGYTVDELIGDSVLKVFYEPDREAAKEKIALCLEQPGRSMSWELRKIRKNGTMLWVRETARAVLRANGPIVLVACEDITERKRAEEALRRSEAYLADAQRLSHTGSWAFTVNSKTAVYWSEENFLIWGFDPQQGPPDRETFFQRIHPEERDRVRESFQKALRERRDYADEFRIVRPNGRVRHIHMLGHPVFSASGEIVEVVGTHVDVTERRRAEEELRAAETRFRTYVDHATDALFVTDAQGKIVEVNRQACESLRYTREELIGMAPRDFNPRLGVDDAFIRWVKERLDAGEIFDFEASHRRKDGSLFPVEVRLRPFLHRDHRFALALVRDITERKRAEEEHQAHLSALESMVRNLAESERKLEEAQRLTHVGYWDRDLDTGVITWSDETYRIYGVPVEEHALTIERVQELIHPEDRPMVFEAVSAALRGGSRYEVEYRVIRPDGEARIVHSQADVTWDESGRPRRMFGTVQNITERKRAEQRLLVQHTVTQILAEAATVEEATPKILGAIGECLGWDVGALWRVDREAGVLRCIEVWHKQSVEVPEFESASREITFLPGIGLPGRVWFSRGPMYIPDVVRDANFLRAPIAERERVACGFRFSHSAGAGGFGGDRVFQS